jgi:hypothetical protein
MDSFIPVFFQKEARIRIAIGSLLLILVGVGLWLRLRNLGELGLIVDEGIQALAVKGILNHGVPKLDSGAIYTRALSFLYIQAGLVKLFELNPLWLRLPSVLFGVAVIIPSYVLGKTLFTPQVGLLTAAIMTFSVWEIELSRYARPYTAFQFVYLTSLLCFYRGFICNKWNYKIFFILSTCIAFTLQNLSLILVTCFLIPIFSTSYALRRKLGYVGWALVFVVLFALYLKLLEFLHSMGGPLLPAEAQEPVTNILARIRMILWLPLPYLPDLGFFWGIAQQIPLLIAGLVLLPGLTSIYLIYRFSRTNNVWQILFAISMIWMAFIYQFGLVLILLALYIVIFAGNFHNLADPILQVTYVEVTIFLVLWCLLMALNPSTYLNQIVLLMFGFPYFIKYFLYWLVIGWPLMTVIFAIGCIILLLNFIHNRDNSIPLFILGSLFIPAILTSFFSTYAESRYIFHLYPLIVIVFSMISINIVIYFSQYFPCVNAVYRFFTAIPVIVLILLVSQDGNPLYGWNIGNRTYLSSRDPIKSIINWKPYAAFHQDQKTPSSYVREHLLSRDQVIALGPSFMLGVYYFYLGKIDYILLPSKDTLSYGKLKDGRVIDYATGSDVLHGLPMLRELMQKNSGGLWLLGDLTLFDAETDYYSDIEKEYLSFLTHDADYIGLDGRTFALRIR